MKLTQKQKRFCDEYLIDFNATRAAEAAGYSRKTAYAIGAENLKKVEIQNYLNAKQEKTANKLDITREMLVEELRKIAFFDIRNIYTIDGGLKNVHEFEDNEAGAVAAVESYDVKEPDSGMILGTTQKVKIHNKIQAIERICKMLGFNAPEKTELTGKDGKLIQTQITHNVIFKKAGEKSKTT